MRATLSVLALYTWDDSIFDSMALPDGVDKGLVRDMCLLDADDYEVVYPDPKWFKIALGIWSKQQMPTWQRQWDVMQIEYNPLYSSYRTEHRNTLETRDLNKTTSGNHDKNYTQSIDRNVDTNVDETQTLSQDVDENTSLKREVIEQDDVDSSSQDNSDTHSETDTVSHDNETADTDTDNTADRTNRGEVQNQTSTIPYNSATAQLKQLDVRNDTSGYDDTGSVTVALNDTKNGTINVTSDGTVDNTTTANVTNNKTIDATDTGDNTKTTTNNNDITTDTKTSDDTDISHDETATDNVNDTDEGTIDTNMWFEMQGSGENNSAQQLLTQEWEFAKLNLYNEIVRAFLFKFCLLVR